MINCWQLLLSKSTCATAFRELIENTKKELGAGVVADDFGSAAVASMGRTKHGHDPVHSAALGSALMDIIGDFQIPRTVLKAGGAIKNKHSADVESTKPSPRVGVVQVETS